MKHVDKRIEFAKNLIKRGFNDSDKNKLREAIAILDELYLDIVFANNLPRKYKKIIRWVGEILSELRKATCAFYDINPQNLELTSPQIQQLKAHGIKIKNLLFLRPLRSSRRLLLPDLTSRIRNRLYADSKNISIVTIDYWPFETLLHASLYNCWACIAMGGVYEVFGMGRVLHPDWRPAINHMIDMSERILFLPDASDGMRWEIETIIKKNKLDKLEVIMLPASLKSVCDLNIDPFGSGDFDNVEQMWVECQQSYKAFGLELPEYVSEGAFIHFSPDGRSVSQLPFGKLLRGEWQ